VHAFGGVPGRGDGVADRADLHADEVIELPASVSDSLCAGTFACPFPDVYPVSFLRAI
jgi:hypothetical protein